jgi:hypothetical protein
MVQVMPVSFLFALFALFGGKSAGLSDFNKKPPAPEEAGG